MESLLSAPPLLAEKLITSANSSLWLVPAVSGYFGYVVLGALSPEIHEHVFTGDMDKPVMDNLRKGQIVTFPKQTYKIFYFPSYLKYWNTYRLHTLGSGIWLLTGFYNLRSQPELGRLANGKVGYPRSGLHRLSGYAYLVSGFIKAITVPLMTYHSHSLARWIRPILATYGAWDVVSLVIAAYHIVYNRNIPLHNRWMIRNFSVGAGSIWVRIFGAVWAALDLSFMRQPKLFGQMNNVALIGGFTYGILFGEWWLAKSNPKKRQGMELLMAATCVWVAVMGKRMYMKDTKNNESQRTSGSGCPAL